MDGELCGLEAGTVGARLCHSTVQLANSCTVR